MKPLHRTLYLASILSVVALLPGCGDDGGESAVSGPPAPTGPVFTVVETIAGQAGVRGGNDGPGNLATFNYPESVAATQPRGSANTGSVLLYIAGGNEKIRVQQVNGGTNPVSTVIGIGQSGTVDGNVATAQVRSPTGMAVGDTEGPLYVYQGAAYWTEPGPCDGTNCNVVGSIVRKLTDYPLNGNRAAVTIAGSVTQRAAADGAGINARFRQPQGLVYNRRTGELFIADSGNYTIRRLRFTADYLVDTISGLAGQMGTVDGAGAGARFNYLFGIAMDRAENLYVTEYFCIRKITPAGMVSTFAGKCDGGGGYVDGSTIDARFNGASGIAVDEDDNVYVTEIVNHTVRKISQAGVVTTVAGIAGVVGAADGALTAATFNKPRGLSYFNKELFVADTDNQTIRRIR